MAKKQKLGSKKAATARLPVNVDGVQERMLQEAELRFLSSQLQNFTSWRDRLVASGKDADARYRQILARRDQLAAELKNLKPVPVLPGVSPALGSGIMSSPLAPSRWPVSLGGFSGFVQMGRSDEIDTIAITPPGANGSIATLALSDNGGIDFTGEIEAGHDPNIHYSFMHRWGNMVVFPTALTRSAFTYSFLVFVEVNPVSQDQFYFYSVMNLLESHDIHYGEGGFNPIPSVWPISRNVLPQVLDVYEGLDTVQRSFEVEPGQTPAIGLELVVGAILESGTSVSFPSTSTNNFVRVMASDRSGWIGAIRFRYDPLPPPFTT